MGEILSLSYRSTCYDSFYKIGKMRNASLMVESVGLSISLIVRFLIASRVAKL